MIGSGCIAQVYRGHVHDGQHGGVDVAVKVIHPNVKACVCMHVLVMTMVLKVCCSNLFIATWPSLGFLHTL